MLMNELPVLPLRKLNTYRTLGSKRYRRKEGLFITEGLKLLREGLASGWQPEALVWLRGTARPADLPVLVANVAQFQVDTAGFADLSEQVNPEGVVAVWPLPQVPQPADPDQLTQAAIATVQQHPHKPFFLLHEVQDPGNLGALLRTADWFGFGGVYCSPGTVDVWNPKVLRGGMGAQFRLPVQVVPQWREFLRALQPRILALTLGGESLQPALATQRNALLLGNEAKGLPTDWLAELQIQSITIPGGGGAESLNVTVAGGIVAYWWCNAQPGS
jgi:TrmH family RNA methyltransferase